MTVHDLFAADHAQLRQQVVELQTTLAKSPERLEELFPLFQKNVQVHFHKENDIYYPQVDAGKRINDRELLHHLRNDHAAVVFTLESLAIRLRKKVPLQEWKTKFDGMVNVLLPHFDLEEKKLFPEVERLLTPAELQTLLDKVQALG